MKNKIINMLLTYCLNLAIISVLIGCSIFFYFNELNGPIIIFFFTVLIFMLLPIMNKLRSIINSIISPIKYRDLYIQTVGSILNIASFDDVLRDTFDQILNLIDVKVGFLVFYYQDKREFNVFYQKNKRRKTIRNAKISHDHIILKIINGPEDIVIKSRLDPLIHFEKSIIDELDKLNGEVVVPIYYHEMFLGFIIAGERIKKYSDKEIRLLKIFASRMAIIAVNSYFFNEIVKKKELEKEYELATKVQKKFLPDLSFSIGKIEARVYHETTSLMIRGFYDVFVNDTVEDDVRISAYRIRGNLTGTSILLPGVQSLIQSFSRLLYPPYKVISKVKSISIEKDLPDRDLVILHGSIRQNGEFTFFNDGYPSPLIYKKRGKRLNILAKTDKGRSQTVKLDKGDLLIISCESFNELLITNMNLYAEIIDRYNSASLNKLKSALAKAFLENIKIKEETEDRLLLLVRMEDAL